MKHVRMMGVAFFLLAMQLVCLPVKADDKADYLKLAQKVRQEVWDNTPADFKKRTVPAKYKNESAVILSYYRELSTDYYRKATTELFVNLRLTRQIDCEDMERMLIQLNDKKALKDYSEFSFRTKNTKKTNINAGIRLLNNSEASPVLVVNKFRNISEAMIEFPNK